MKINGLRSIVVAAVILGITLSCQKDEDFLPQSDNFLSENEIQGMTKLGKQLENPYSVENMRKAFDNLKSASPNNRISGNEIEITTSHYYIKFKPKNEDELSILKRDSTLILFEYPLDYEILEGGTHFHDPSVPIGTPTFQYVSIPIDKKIPDGVGYEILENLFIPDEEKDSNISNGRIARDELIDLLVEESLRLTGNLNDVESKPNSRVQSSSWRPAG